MSFVAYQWRDEPILDIDAWAAERGEKIVVAEKVVGTLSLSRGGWREQREEVRMPESFWSGFRVSEMGGGREMRYREIRREEPRPRSDDEA